MISFFLSVYSTSHLLCPAKPHLRLLPRPPGSRRLSIQGSFSEQRPNGSNRNILDPKNLFFFNVFLLLLHFAPTFLTPCCWAQPDEYLTLTTLTLPPALLLFSLPPRTFSSCVFLLFKTMTSMWLNSGPAAPPPLTLTSASHNLSVHNSTVYKGLYI